MEPGPYGKNRHNAPANRDRACRGDSDACQYLKDRRLAGAVRADDAKASPV